MIAFSFFLVVMAIQGQMTCPEVPMVTIPRGETPLNVSEKP